jgi:hypothetical protein
MPPFTDTIDAMLATESTDAPQQRLTSHSIHQRLITEYAADISYRTVRN